MAKRVKYLKNAPLEVGDEVVCVNMDDQFSPVKAGTTGVVKSVSNVQGSNVYYVKWDSGSSLALLDGVDQWRKVAKEDDEEQLSESRIVLVRTKKDILKNKF
jgi:hypothetical protein